VTGAGAGEIYPKPEELPDLFEGSQLVLVGRYGVGSGMSVTLTGDVLGKPQSFVLDARLASVSTEASFLPRLWASRKIGYLLDEIRDEKDPARRKEIEEQIIGLSKEFGVLTPYTAMFVPEPGTADQPIRRLQLGAPGAPSSSGGFGGAGGFVAKADMRSGESAVNLSQSARGGRAQNQAGNLAAITSQSGADKKLAEAQARQIQYTGNRAFYQRGTNWEDGTYDPKKQTELVKIKLYSDAYFALVRRSGDWAKWAAVGANVVVVASAKKAIQFSEDGKEKLTDKELDALLKK
jgi:Ca-activated chloride channel family protein